MKLFKVFVAFSIVILAGMAFALEVQEVVDPEEENTQVEKKLKGCGYSRPLVVAGMIGNPPFGWVERHEEHDMKDLESYGLGRLILDELANKLGISYVSTGFLSYHKALTALKRGEIDLLFASYYHSQDLQKGTSILTPGYFKNVFTAYFKKGKEIAVMSLNDLGQKRGIIRKEENIYPLIYQKLPSDIKLTQITGAKKAFEMLMNDEADYLITSPYAAEAELRRYKLNEDIVPAANVLFDSYLFFVFSTNSNCPNLKDLKRKFSETLKNEDFSAPRIQEMAMQLVDQWGEKFRDVPGLMEEEETEESPSAPNDIMPPVPAKD